MSATAVAAAFDGLGQALYARLARVPGNVALSPLSIGLAMAMTLSGARGETEAEMKRALGHAMSRNEIEAACADLLQKLAGYGQRDATHIAIANALLLDEERGGAILVAYRKLLQDCFAAEIMAGATAEAVNRWVAGKTMGLVPHLLDRVDELCATIILNAMVFAAPWAAVFDPEETRPERFVLSNGASISVPTMRNRLYLAAHDDAGWRAVRIPFSTSPLGLVVVVPRDGAALEAVEADLDLPKLSRLWAPRYVELALPKFRVVSDFDLAAPLRDAGLRLAFEDRADFSGMAVPDFDGVKIAKVRHGACIDVHEAGCFAAAATVVEIAVRGAMAAPEPEPFHVDRPFMFYLVEDRTGATLMRGRVVDPRP